MKKLCAIALVAVMPFLLISCGGNNANDVDMSPSPEVSFEDNIDTETFDNNTLETEENNTTIENTEDNLVSPSTEVSASPSVTE